MKKYQIKFPLLTVTCVDNIQTKARKLVIFSRGSVNCATRSDRVRKAQVLAWLDLHMNGRLLHAGGM